MNIVFVTRRYLPHIGGVEKHIAEISKVLGRKKHKITVVCEHFGSEKEKEKIGVVKVYRIKYPHKKILGLLSIWLWFIKNLRLFSNVDLVHAHDSFIWCLPLRFLLPRKRVFMTFHGWEGVYPIPRRYIFLKKLAASLSHGNICVGSYIEKWYGIKADSVIWGAADINLKLKIKNLKLRDKSLRILYVGRLDSDTGLKTYLKALQLIKAKYKTAVIEFLGDGPLRADCEDLGKVHGFQKDVLPYLARTRFILTSGYLSMIEAMQAQKLVFPTYNNSLKADIIWLSPFNDLTVSFSLPDTLVRKIGFFLNNPDQEKKIVEKASHWAKMQTWGNVTQVYLRLWSLK